MLFTKEELSVLDIYVSMSDTKQVLNNKIQIKTILKENKIVFSQFSSDAVLITIFEKENLEEFIGLYESVKLNQLIKLCPQKATIEITDQGVLINNKSKYDFKSLGIELKETDFVLDLIKNKKFKHNIKIKDISKMLSLRSFVGIDNFDAIMLRSGYFIASNNSDVLGAIQSGNDVGENTTFYFPSIVTGMFNNYKINDVEVFGIEGYNYFIIGNTYIFFPEKEYSFIDIFQEEIKTKYRHPNYIVVNKNSFAECLQRISIVADRIYLSFNENNLVLESKSFDNDYAKEEIKIENNVVDSIKNNIFFIPVRYLSMTTSSLQGDKVYIHIPEDMDEASNIMIQDNKNDRFYIHTLHEIAETVK
jgi:hypothetical protein